MAQLQIGLALRGLLPITSQSLPALALSTAFGSQCSQLWALPSASRTKDVSRPQLPRRRLDSSTVVCSPRPSCFSRPLAIKSFIDNKRSVIKSPLHPGSTAQLGLSRQFSAIPRFSVGITLTLAPTLSTRFPGQGQTRLYMLPTSRNTLANLESSANNNPGNASAQAAFYSALLRANMPELVAERYESGRYASNMACENVYTRAMERLGRATSTRNITEQGTRDGSLNHEQLQAIGQAVAAHTRGSNVALGGHAKTYTNSGNTSNSDKPPGNGDRENPLYVVVEETIGGTIFKWVKFLFNFGLILYFTLVVLTLMVETTGFLKKVGGNTSNEAQASHQTVRFSDVHGCDEAKEELQELVEFLKDPTRFSTLGGKLPKGVLLVGPPGTGKTLLARAVAGEAGVPFFFMSGSEFDEVYVGVGAKRVRELFAQARAKAPAIVFIDELDAVGGKRNERDAAYVKQTLNQLLVDLDGFAQNSGVVFLAATNFPQLLDKALTRPGRFDRNIVVPLPDVKGRIEIIKHHMKNIQIGPDVDASLLARGTPGFSGAELENLVNQAAVRASRNRSPAVTMKDMEWAKDKIIMGAERKSAVIPQAERKLTAYHEGGHAIVGLFTEGHHPVYKVTIMPRGQALGITHFLPEGDMVSLSKKQILAQIDTALGGKIAEELIFGSDNVTTGCSSDLHKATRLARAMVTQYGMSDELGNVNLQDNYNSLSSQTKEKIEEETRKIIEAGRQRAMALLQSKKKELHLLAKALVEYESLDQDEIKKVINGEELKGKMKILPQVPVKLPERTVKGVPGAVVSPPVLDIPRTEKNN
ncbi:ATP-dependent metallopeptidase Hfl [Terfezia boudieri ATCC MYA-4762]|uniref:ATP-dependent metallopeptidase Hfl n=1 Tax=Terfezia boudieri ATCC MYA-4762 TaxID=1051890 RepID=A0A3N4LFQ2_9PEZI|nr:ATP-dependent metallopeptidase Hfl [Terfezia boudieri ATCC MYA-4762]